MEGPYSGPIGSTLERCGILGTCQQRFVKRDIRMPQMEEDTQQPAQ